MWNILLIWHPPKTAGILGDCKKNPNDLSET